MTAITTDFNDETAALDVVQDIDLAERRVVVTGAASGIGVETARALCHAGAQVTLAVRDPVAGQRVATELSRATGRTDLVSRCVSSFAVAFD